MNTHPVRTAYILAVSASIASATAVAQISSEALTPLRDPKLRLVLDYDGDGVEEIITPDFEAFSVDPEGALVFERKIVNQPLLRLYQILMADMDGDGADDLVTLQTVGEGTASYATEVGLFFNRGGLLFEYDPTGVPWSGGDRVALTDFDADGDIDVLLYPNYEGGFSFGLDEAGPIRLVENTGSGGLLPARPVSPAAEPIRGAEPADMDQDGDLDFVAFADQSTNILLARNTGQGFEVEILRQALFQYLDLEVGDLNGDSAKDIACLRRAPGTNPEGFIDVYSSDPSGTFGSPQNVLFALPDSSPDITLCDPDGDGDLDLMLATQAFTGSVHQVATLINNGQGGFTSPRFSSSAPGLTLGSAQQGDFDGDGFDDLLFGVVLELKQLPVRRLGNGPSNPVPFGDGVLTGVANDRENATVGDLDGDGMNDLLVPGPSSVAWARGDANGDGFEPAELLGVEGTVRFVANLDDDPDGELVIERHGADQLFVVDILDGGAVGLESELSQTTTEIDPSTGKPVDVDGDGDLDILAVRTDGNDLVWFENQGMLQFATGAPLGLASPGTFYSFDTGDFNGDGQADVLLKTLLTFPFIERFEWREGLGGGAFGPIIPVGLGGNATTVLDVNGDGADDLIWRTGSEHRIAWTPGGPSGLVPSDGIELIPMTNDGEILGLADYDGDGLRDILVVSPGTQVLGHRALSAAQDFSAVGVEVAPDLVENPFYQRRVQLADLGSDGDLDLLVGIQNSPLRWFRNDTNGATGSSFCGPAVENSTGLPSRILALGSSDAQGTGLRLRGLDLPTNAFGFFIVSETQVPATPVIASSGRICLGGAVGRYVSPDQVQFSGVTGTFAADIDLGSIPQPGGFVAASPGSTWSFQAWHRDSQGGAATSNFTDGVQVNVQ